MGSPLSTISPDNFLFFQISQFSNFYDFCSFSLTWDPMGAQNAPPPPDFIRSEKHFRINKVVTGGYKVMVYIGDLPKFKNCMVL